MNDLFLFSSAVRHNPAVDAWLRSQSDELRALAETWFARMRACGPDVHEVMHDCCATACVGEAAFAHVGVYRRHVSVYFFFGAFLDDPRGLLEGTGKRGRHVKVRPEQDLDERALAQLITTAYEDMRQRLASSPPLTASDD